MAEILIIEDEVGIAESLAYLLRQEGFEVRRAGRLAEGREAAPRAELIVLDLTLPDGSGLELLRELRAGAKTPVIISGVTWFGLPGRWLRARVSGIPPPAGVWPKTPPAPQGASGVRICVSSDAVHWAYCYIMHSCCWP